MLAFSRGAVGPVLSGVLVLGGAAPGCGGETDLQPGRSSTGGSARANPDPEGAGGTATGGLATSGAAGSGNVPSASGGAVTTGGVAGIGGVTGGATTGFGGTAAACSYHDMFTTTTPAVLELVVDASASMGKQAYPTDPANLATKLDEVKRILPAMLASFPSDWAVGLELSSYSGTGCYRAAQAVAIGPLAANLAAIDLALASATAQGYAPTAAAWQFGLAQAEAYNDPNYSSSPRAVVLFTDGVPTAANDGCAVSAPISQAEYDGFVAEVTLQRQTPGPVVKTFVVGIPGSNDPQGASYDPMFELSLLAIAGGTAPAGCTPFTGVPSGNRVNPRGTYCHFDMTANGDVAAGLSQALQSNRSQPVSCSFSIPPVPGGRDTRNLQVVYGSSSEQPRPLSRASGSACKDGQWYATALDASGFVTALELCPDTCQALAADPSAQIGISLGCYPLP
jgi:hypothetical protein